MSSKKSKDEGGGSQWPVSPLDLLKGLVTSNEYLKVFDTRLFDEKLFSSEPDAHRSLVSNSGLTLLIRVAFRLLLQDKVVTTMVTRLLDARIYCVRSAFAHLGLW